MHAGTISIVILFAYDGLQYWFVAALLASFTLCAICPNNWYRRASVMCNEEFPKRCACGKLCNCIEAWKQHVAGAFHSRFVADRQGFFVLVLSFSLHLQLVAVTTTIFLAVTLAWLIC